MKKYKKISKNLQVIRILILLITVGFIITSCIRDEILVVTPLIVGNDCDTTNISFSKIVMPKLASCVPCHNNSNKYAGINLDGYDNIISVAQTGQLLGSLRISMSSYFNGTDCDIAKIKAWINQGSKNN